MLGSILEE